jgi:hypothetical protein
MLKLSHLFGILAGINKTWLLMMEVEDLIHRFLPLYYQAIMVVCISLHGFVGYSIRRDQRQLFLVHY